MLKDTRVTVLHRHSNVIIFVAVLVNLLHVAVHFLYTYIVMEGECIHWNVLEECILDIFNGGWLPGVDVFFFFFFFFLGGGGGGVGWVCCCW